MHELIERKILLVLKGIVYWEQCFWSQLMLSSVKSTEKIFKIIDKVCVEN